MRELPMGANTSLGSRHGDVVIRHAPDPTLDVNLTAFLVGADGRVRTDADMVFFNQPEAEGGCARFHAPRIAETTVEHRLSFDLARLPDGIEKIVVALTEDRGPGFAALRDLTAHTGDVRLSPVPTFSEEKGLMVAEVYVRGGQDKVRAVWQGFSSGLHGLATAHGVEVEVDEAEPAVITLEKASGTISLQKGDKPVLIEKTPLITASISWTSGTDYDVYALVMTRDGKQKDVATFGADGVPPRTTYGRDWVKHLGDATGDGSGTNREAIEIRLVPEIAAVVPVAYSALANGTGSFYRYKVSLRIDNHSGTTVELPAEDANVDDNVYTCVPGIIRNTPDGVAIERLELYSARDSEARPLLKLDKSGTVTVLMDEGPINDFK
jgi:tellurite resistance protein TerA